MRRALVILTLLVLATLAPTGSALAQSSPQPSITTPDVPAGCVGHSIGEPECGVKPQHPGDRGGWAQELLFLLVLGGMGIIFFVVIRSTRARARASSQP